MNGSHYSFNCVNICSSITLPWERKCLAQFRWTSARVISTLFIIIQMYGVMFRTVHLMRFETMRRLWNTRSQCAQSPWCDETKPIASSNSFMVRHVIIYVTLQVHTRLNPWMSKLFCNDRELSALMCSASLISCTREPLIVASQRIAHKGIHYERTHRIILYRAILYDYQLIRNLFGSPVNARQMQLTC